jgi:hypothetical protein
VLASIEPVHARATIAALRQNAPPLSPSYLDHGRGLWRSTQSIVVEGFGGVVRRTLWHRARRRLAARRAAAPARPLNPADRQPVS